MLKPPKDIFSVVNLYQTFSQVFDFCTESSSSFKSSIYCYLRLLLLVTICLVTAILLAERNFVYMESESEILNVGLNLMFIIGVVGSIALKLSMFWRRKNIWKILVNLSRIDLNVSI